MLTQQSFVPSFQLSKVFQRVQREVVPVWNRHDIECITALVRNVQIALCDEMDEHTRRIRTAGTLAAMEASSRAGKRFAAESFIPQMAMLENITDAMASRQLDLNEDDDGDDYAA